MLHSALMGQAYGAYVVLLREEFGWSKTLLSGASSLREAESGVMGPFQGMLLDRVGPRAVVLAGSVVLGVGFILFSQVNSPLAFFGAFFVMSVGASLMGYMTVTFAVVHWFERRRATAISLTTGGFALGGMVVPLTVLALEHLGWRTTALLSGLVIMAAGIPLSRVFHHYPHQLGLAPDGDAVEDVRGWPGGRPPPSSDFTLGEALREPSFWWLSLGHASALFVVSAMSVHLLSHLNQSQGYSLGQGAAVVFLMTLVFLAGTISGGLLGDRVDKRKLVVLCMGMHAAGLLMLSHAVNLAMVLAFAVLHGMAWGWRGPQMSALRADYFGRAAFGKILGVSNIVIIFGSISGPLIAGILFDQTGNYRIGFDILAVIAAAGSIFFILARRPPPPRRVGDVAAAPLQPRP